MPNGSFYLLRGAYIYMVILFIVGYQFYTSLHSSFICSIILLLSVVILFAFLSLKLALLVSSLIYFPSFVGNTWPCYGYSCVWGEWMGWPTTRSGPSHKCYCCCSWTWTCPWQYFLLPLQGLFVYSFCYVWTTVNWPDKDLTMEYEFDSVKCPLASNVCWTSFS